VILNADDFGRSRAINEAVKRAYQQGVLTSASLMVTGDAVEDALKLAARMPGLAVGLHIVLVDGPSALPAGEIPHLVDRSGRFPDNALQVGLCYALDRRSRRELRRELVAQFERFAATGLPLSHVDSHHHIHMHPTVFALLPSLAARYGARGIRVPRDDLRLSLGYDRTMVSTKFLWAIAFGLLSLWCRYCLRGSTLSIPVRVYGVMQSGRMHERYVMHVLDQLRVPTTELFFHPSVGPEAEELGPNASDLDTLLSPSVRRVICERGLLLSRYADLEMGSRPW
jgi:hopanoid biosynthesis associated protein HpnK